MGDLVINFFPVLILDRTNLTILFRFIRFSGQDGYDVDRGQIVEAIVPLQYKLVELVKRVELSAMNKVFEVAQLHLHDKYAAQLVLASHVEQAASTFL